MEPAVAAVHFNVEGQLVTVDSYGAGNVNDTFIAVFRTTFSEERFVVQRINTNVFSEPEWIMENMRVVTDHVHAKLKAEAKEADRIWQLPAVIPTKEGRDFFMDDDGGFWRAITLIASAQSYEKPESAEHVLEAGTVLGQFHRLISDLDPTSLHDTLPEFHHTPVYLRKYDDILTGERSEKLLTRSVEARRLHGFIEERRDLVNVLEEGIAAGDLATRPIHGDPKVANIMIDDLSGKGTSIVDLDTVKPGLVHYDFGDAVRSTCNPVGEEALNLSEVLIDLDLFEA